MTASAHSPVPPPLTVVPPPPLPPAPDDGGFSPLPAPRPPSTELGRALLGSQHDGRQLAHSTTVVGSGSIVGSVSSASLMVNPYGVAVSGSFAYVAAYSSDSLVVVDISNPASTVIRGSVVSSSLLDSVRVQPRALRALMASGAPRLRPHRPSCSRPQRHHLLKLSRTLMCYRLVPLP